MMEKDNKTQIISGIILGINCSLLEIPNELREFLKKDDQGMDGFLFMLSHYKLSKKIPPEVRVQYETLRGILLPEIENSLTEMRKCIDELENNPDEIIKNFIDHSIDND